MKVKKLGEKGTIDLLSGEWLVGLDQRGRFTHSAGLGFGTFGAVQYGETQKIGGIYQRRRKGYNNFSGSPPPNSPIYYVKMRSYAPTNPRTGAQQANRQKFKDAIDSWYELTTEQKNAYNKRATRNGRVGYFLYISEYLKSH